MANISNNKVFDLIEDGQKLDLFKNTLKDTGGLTNVLTQMVEHSEIDPDSPDILDKVKGKYDIKGRFDQANLPSGYSFRDMDRPLGVPGTGGSEINIQDILQQRDIVRTDINNMNRNQSIYNEDYQGTDTPSLNKVLNSMHKLNYMIHTSMDWSEEDTKREQEVMKEEVLEMYNKFPDEFPQYKNIEELKAKLYG